MAAKQNVAISISYGVPFPVVEKEGKLYYHTYNLIEDTPPFPVPENFGILDTLQQYFAAKKQTPDACVCFQYKDGFVFDPECQKCVLRKYITDAVDSEGNCNMYKNEYDQFFHKYNERKEELQRIDLAISFVEKLKVPETDKEALMATKMLLLKQRGDTFEAMYGLDNQ